MGELGSPQPLDRSEEIIAKVVVRQTIGTPIKSQKETDFKIPQIFSLFALVLAIGLILPLIATLLNPTVVTVLSKTVPFLLGAVFIGKLESIRDRVLSVAAKKWIWIGIIAGIADIPLLAIHGIGSIKINVPLALTPIKTCLT